jgi:hypothetical protein
MGRWRTFQRLSWRERGLFFLALFLLPITALALRLMGLRRTQAVMMRLSPSPNPRGENERGSPDQPARVLAKFVRAAAAHGPYRANCLQQSLVLWWLLRQRRIESNLYLGVSKVPGGMEAHAWVECGGRPPNDREDAYLRFTPFQRAILPG